MEQWASQSNYEPRLSWRKGFFLTSLHPSTACPLLGLKNCRIRSGVSSTPGPGDSPVQRSSLGDLSPILSHPSPQPRWMNTPVLMYLRSNTLPPLRSLFYLSLLVTVAYTTPEPFAPPIATLSLSPVITKQKWRMFNWKMGRRRT